MKRLVIANIKSTVCNMRCSYCFVGSETTKKIKPPEFDYPVAHMAKALSRDRLGGTCLINLVSSGETLMFEESIEFTRRMLEQGHFVYLVTNMVLSKRVDQLLALPESLRRRLIFHPSFHFLELKRLGKMEEYFSNMRRALAAGCSCAPSMVFNEDYAPFLEEIEGLWMRQMWGLPQLTPVRNVERPELPVKFDRLDEFIRNGAFDSASYRFAKQLENVRRTEFCYAGDWGIMLNLLTGDASKCLFSNPVQNVFRDLGEPILFEAQGRCKAPWCLCGPTLLAAGMIPELPGPTLAESRGRDDWLTAEAREFLGLKLSDSNTKYSAPRKWWVASGRKKVRRISKKLASAFLSRTIR